MNVLLNDVAESCRIFNDVADATPNEGKVLALFKILKSHGLNKSATATAVRRSVSLRRIIAASGRL